MLSRLAGIVEETEKHYENYMFFKIYRLVYNFCVYEISSLYLDILKDRLYTFGTNSFERRSCQTVLYEILKALLKLLAPILSFTTEEAYRELCPDSGSIHTSLLEWDEDKLEAWKTKDLDDKWEKLLKVREEVLKVLEAKRAAGEIGSSLEARVLLYSDKENFAGFLKENASLLPAFFIVSEVDISEAKEKDSHKCDTLPLWISAEKAEGKKCQRCWNYSLTVGQEKGHEDICLRCLRVIQKMHTKEE